MVAILCSNYSFLWLSHDLPKRPSSWGAPEAASTQPLYLDFLVRWPDQDLTDGDVLGLVNGK